MSKLIRDLSFVSRCGARYRSRELEPLGLRARQSLSLIAVCENPGISQDALARRVALDKSNITRQLSILEESGLVERRSCQNDKRIIQLFPTDAAIALLPKIRSAAQAWEQYITEDFSPDELLLMEKLVGRMKEKAQQWMEVD